MNFVECFLKDTEKYRYSVVYCKVEEMKENFIVLKDEKGIRKFEGEFRNLKKGEKVRIFLKNEKGKIKILKIIKAEGFTIYTESKIINLLNKIFK